MNTGEGTKRQWSTKHYTANYKFPNANALKSGGKTQVFRKGIQFLSH
jgi:hypothetical protein